MMLRGDAVQQLMKSTLLDLIAGEMYKQLLRVQCSLACDVLHTHTMLLMNCSWALGEHYRQFLVWLLIQQHRDTW